jgi:Tol biopolymer transport system component
VDLATGAETCLLERFVIKHFVFSPDGSRIIFSGWEPGKARSGVYLFTPENRAVETLVSGWYESTFPQISPHGDAIIYASWRRDTNGDGIIDFRDNSGIYLLNLADRTEKEIVSDRYNNTFPSFTADGRHVVFLSTRRDSNNDGVVNSLDNAGVYFLDLDRKREWCVVEDAFYNKFPCATPDQAHLIFTSNWRRDNKDNEGGDYFEYKGIYRTDILTRDIEQIVSDKYYGSRSPAVSPRGDAVAYVSWRRNTNRGLYLARLDRLPDRDELHSYVNNNI